MMKNILVTGLSTLMVITACQTASAINPARNGTTLAAYKTIDICNVCNGNGNWTVYGEIAVWNQGAIDTVGLDIKDILEKRAGNQWARVTVLSETFVPDPTGYVIPAGTTMETATIFRYYLEIVKDSVAETDIVRNTADISIMNHSGHLGTAFGPAPKVTWSGVFACPEGGSDNAMGCTRTQGYWGNKPGVIWPAPFSRDAVFFLSGQTWQQVMDTPVNASQGYYQLAHQYIAAVLNQASGAKVPAGVQDTLKLAADWLAANGPAACPNGGSCGLQKDWAAVLDSFNKGEFPGGPGHCVEETGASTVSTAIAE